jgi:hypothetical protein
VRGSACARPLSDAELRPVFDASRRNNPRLGVTGTLLYREGNFLQVLEGDERVVRGLRQRVDVDPRHRGGMTHLQGPSSSRMFPAWTSALRSEVEHAAEHRRALDAFMRDASSLPAERARAVLRIILVFLRIMR